MKNKEYANLLISFKIDFNTLSQKGNTVFHLAAYGGRQDILETLIHCKNIDINARNVKDDTTLDIAAYQNHPEILQLLLQHGAIEVNTANNMSKITPLHYAAQTGNAQSVQHLLDHKKIQVNAVDSLGNTPLHDAISNKKCTVVDLLLQHDQIDLSIKNNRKQTVLDLAPSDPILQTYAIFKFLKSNHDEIPNIAIPLYRDASVPLLSVPSLYLESTIPVRAYLIFKNLYSLIHRWLYGYRYSFSHIVKTINTYVNNRGESCLSAAINPKHIKILEAMISRGVLVTQENAAGVANALDQVSANELEKIVLLLCQYLPRKSLQLLIQCAKTNKNTSSAGECSTSASIPQLNSEKRNLWITRLYH